MVKARRGGRSGRSARCKRRSDLVDVPERVGIRTIAKAAFAERGGVTGSVREGRDSHCTLEPERSIVDSGRGYQIVDEVDGLGARTGAIVIARHAVAVGNEIDVGRAQKNRDTCQHPRQVLGPKGRIVGPGHAAEIEGVINGRLFDPHKQLRMRRPARQEAGRSASAHAEWIYPVAQLRRTPGPIRSA